MMQQPAAGEWRGCESDKTNESTQTEDKPLKKK